MSRSWWPGFIENRFQQQLLVRGVVDNQNAHVIASSGRGGGAPAPGPGSITNGGEA